jgi:hypothetical protein
MVDVGAGLAILGSAELSKELLGKILGQTAEYIGGGVQQWTERRVENVRRVFQKARDKLGSELERPGAIPPRVLSAILEQGQFAEDDLMAEYLGGVLASSRSRVDRDDRAVDAAATISRLSTYALRTHYVLYAAIHPLVRGEVSYLDLLMAPKLHERAFFLSLTAYFDAMAFSEAELDQFTGIFSETMLALSREDLIRPKFQLGAATDLSASFEFDSLEEDGGIVFTPTQHGIVLFSVAHGVRTDPLGAFSDAESFPPATGVNIPNALSGRVRPTAEGSVTATSRRTNQESSGQE